MNKDICVRCGEGVVNIRVGAIILKDQKVLMVRNSRDDYYYGNDSDDGYLLIHYITWIYYPTNTA